MQCYIYALSDPRNPAIPRYIGRTRKHPRHRLYEHMVAMFRFPNYPLSKWLRQLDRDGKVPTLILYEIVPENSESSPNDREIFWTALFKPLGLLNVKIGDRQPVGQDIVSKRQKWMQGKEGQKWLSNIKSQHRAKQPSLLLWAHRQKFKRIRTEGSKKKWNQVTCVQTGEHFSSFAEAARHVGRSQQGIREATSKGWKCAGLNWKLTNSK